MGSWPQGGWGLAAWSPVTTGGHLITRCCSGFSSHAAPGWAVLWSAWPAAASGSLGPDGQGRRLTSGPGPCRPRSPKAPGQRAAAGSLLARGECPPPPVPIVTVHHEGWPLRHLLPVITGRWPSPGPGSSRGTLLGPTPPRAQGTPTPEESCRLAMIPACQGPPHSPCSFETAAPLHRTVSQVTDTEPQPLGRRLS